VNETTGEPVEGYLETSGFLADVNNEREEKKEVYKERIAQLEKLVMVVFAEDTTVIPKESGWFAEVNKTDGKVTELRDRRIYKEDWIGLKKLDAKGGLVFETTPGDHMQLDEDVLKETFRKYFGPERKLKMLSSGCVHGISVVASWWAWLWSWSPLAEQNIHSGL
jgi:palmitoyl-protein thioesterase